MCCVFRQTGWMALCRLWIHLLLFTLCSAQNDFFTSIGHMTDLLLTEKTLVASLKDYIRAEENKLEQIKKWADKVEALSAAAIKDPEGFLGHPVNAFKLMRRLNKEWAEQGNAALIDVSGGFIANLTVQRQYFPNDADQNGAAEALMRLLDTYQLDTETLSSGRLPGSSPDSSQHSLLTADDCFDLGTLAYSKEDYYQSELWMVQALKQMEDGETPKTADTATILDYLSFSVYQQGVVEKAFEYTKRLLELEPTHQRALGNMKYFEDVLGKRMKAKKRKGGEPKEGPREGRPADYLLERDKYEELCRGEGIKMTPRRQSRLFCRYYDNDRHPKYVIGPVKQEDEWDRPRIVRYHDIVSDREIEKVKEIAKPRLRRATVHQPQTGQPTTAHYRVAKSAWIRAFEHPLVDRINQRIEDLTGLDLSTAEPLQVANYGVGGQYEPHYDFGREDEPDVFRKRGTGNRIATWLLYMSDVSAGGTTVFTDVGAAIVPKKGSAVFWFNLHPSGEGDYRTRHAACPVLVGNKWVSNKWIHERGQEFRRRCGLQKTD